MGNGRTTRRHRKHRPIRFRPGVEALELRLTPAAPVAPVIIEPQVNGQVTSNFDINLQTNPDLYSDPDGDAHVATAWDIRRQSDGMIVWQTGFLSAPPLTLYRVDFSDGTFVGPQAGQTQLAFNTNYELHVRYRDAAAEVSPDAVRTFRTAAATEPVPGAGTWIARQGYVVEPVASGFRLPVNIAFVPNPGPNPSDPLFYVTELYGSIKVVRRDGSVGTYATGLLDYNPQGPISGTGEQGLSGLAVDPVTGDLFVGMLWNNGTTDAQRGGATLHFPKVERLHSNDGGQTMATRTMLLNMQPETQGQSHQISNISIGPDSKLYVHMGDGFVASTALDQNQFRGKVLRMNLDGSAPTDNPFFNAGNGINAQDYIFTYGHRNPFGGAWRAADGKHWVVENGNSVDRMVDLVAGQSYGWSGNDTAITQFAKYNWQPSSAPVNIDFVEATRFGGSGFPAEEMGNAYVSLSGPTYAAGPQTRSKSIEVFSDLDTLGGNGKLSVPPTTLVKYNGTGRATIAGLAAGPDGIYFTDLYRDDGVGGATAAGANVYRVRFVGTTGGEVPTVATAAAATPNPVSGTTTALSVLGADDGGEANLTYTWTLQGTPPAPVSFSANGSNAAKNTTATFSRAGIYNFLVTIRDAGGQAALSNVTVNVDQTLTSVVVAPPSVTLNNGATQQFTATARDQFGIALGTQPGFVWSIDTGGVGTVDATGLYQAPAAGSGSATIRASAGSVSGTALVSVGAPPVGTGNGLAAVYYNNSNHTGTSIVRTDATVNFNFGSGSPNSFIAADTFSGRWVGAIEPRFSETYTFITTSDDGVRLWVDDRLLIDQWNNHSSTQHQGTIALVAGHRYAIRLEHFENTGSAVIRLEWQSASQARQIVPQSQLYSGVPIKINFQPAASPVPSGYLTDGGAVFGNRGNGQSYGWNISNASTSRDRNATNSPDQRYDTLQHMQKPENPSAVWELAVPNGSYRVHVVSGDPNHTDSVFRTNVEGVLAVSGTPTTSTRWFEGWVNVNVVDGRLTISNGSGASNNKINFVDVIPLGFDFSTGFTASAGLTRNGTAAVSGTALRLTSGLANQAGSAFSTGRINTSRFSTRFDFRLTNPAADGITFTIQNSAATALGPSGGGLGFGPDTTGGTGGIASSIAVKFDLYNNQGEGINSTGLFLNGAAPTVGGVAPALGSNDLTGSGIDLHSGHTFRAHIAYDGSRLLVTITDLTTGATATQAYLIDLASVLGGSTAFVGFTGGTGGLTATQDVLSWWYFPS